MVRIAWNWTRYPSLILGKKRRNRTRKQSRQDKQYETTPHALNSRSAYATAGGSLRAGHRAK